MLLCDGVFKRYKKVLLSGKPIGRANGLSVFRQKDIIKMYCKEVVCYSAS